MNLLRAQVKKTKAEDWWQIALLDLQIVADGESEAAMLKDLEHSLILEYHLAQKFGHVPFMNILRAVPTEQEADWCDGSKNFRGLNLPMEVRVAMSAAFQKKNVAEFQVRLDAA